MDRLSSIYLTKTSQKKLKEAAFSTKAYASPVLTTKSPQSNVSNAWKSGTQPKDAKTHLYANIAELHIIPVNATMTWKPNVVFAASRTS
jgi:hypothetical protein